MMVERSNSPREGVKDHREGVKGRHEGDGDAGAGGGELSHRDALDHPPIHPPIHPPTRAEDRAEDRANSTDCGRVARARRALAMAEALAWSGVGARLLSEDVSCGNPGEGAGKDSGKDSGKDAGRHSNQRLGRHARNDTEEAAESGGCRPSRGLCAVESPPRQGKKQRAKQCARDVKHFLAARDAGALRQRHLREGVDESICADEVFYIDEAFCIDEAQRRVRGNAVLHERHSMQSEGKRRCMASTPTVSLGDEACDLALGGGLVCGALHEIRGVSFAGESSVGPFQLTDARFVDARFVEARSVEARSVGGNKADAASETGDWIVPFGCLLHIVRRATAHPSLAGRSVAWIGGRVHPPRHMIRTLRHGHGAASDAAGSACSGAERPLLDDGLGRRSVFIGDAPNGVPEGDRLVGEALDWPASWRRGRKASRSDGQIRARLWCAELAIRMDVAGVIVIDGSGFDHLAWRRLQLAAAAAHKAAQEQVERDGGLSTCGPLVLVVTPPASEAAGGGAVDCGPTLARHAARRLRTAATQWSVSAERASDPIPARDHGTRRRSDAPFQFRWRMHLTHLRSGHGGQIGMESGQDMDHASSPDHAAEAAVGPGHSPSHQEPFHRS